MGDRRVSDERAATLAREISPCKMECDDCGDLRDGCDTCGGSGLVDYYDLVGGKFLADLLADRTASALELAAAKERIAELEAIESAALDYTAWCFIADGPQGCGCTDADPEKCSSCRFAALLGRDRVQARVQALNSDETNETEG